MTRIVTVDPVQNKGLSAAAVLYGMWEASDGDGPILDSIEVKFSGACEAAVPGQETISVELTDEEAALLVRAIDLISGRDPVMEPVREQLGGGETTMGTLLASDANATASDAVEDAHDRDLFDLLFSGGRMVDEGGQA